MFHESGHNNVQQVGDTIYKGEVPNLPYPTSFNLDEAIIGMHRDGYCIFPSVLDAAQVAAFRDKIDNLGGPDEQYE
ncbi:hypothetical protein C1X94_30880, partial [Pseudomonas sp. FW306-02-H05-AB]